MMQNINKFAARQTRPILTDTRSSHSHMSYKIGVLIDVLKNLAKFPVKHPFLIDLQHCGKKETPAR